MLRHAGLRQDLYDPPVVFIVFIGKYRSETVLHMDDAVFQVIAVSLFPFPQSLSTADNPCNVPSIIIGD